MEFEMFSGGGLQGRLRTPKLAGRRVSRRRLLTIELPRHRLGSSLYYTHELVVQFLGPSSTITFPTRR